MKDNLKRLLNRISYVYGRKVSSYILLLSIFLSNKSIFDITNSFDLVNIIDSKLDEIEMTFTESFGKITELAVAIDKEFQQEVVEAPEVIEEEIMKPEEIMSPEEIIMDKYNLSEEEFKTIVGVVLAEAKVNSYEDAYAVINTIYNRTKSKIFIHEMKRVMDRDDGDNLYVQVICPGQFSTYIEGTYKKMWERTDVIGYQALIDFLLSEKSMHNYLGFWGDCLTKEGSVQFVSHGNRYFYELTEEDRVEEKEFSLKRERINRDLIN